MTVRTTDAPGDLKYMRQALEVAKNHPDLARGKAVGAILIRVDEVVGVGFRATVHNVGNLSDWTIHAEHMAIAVAGVKARGATLYVTMEPCTRRAEGMGWWKPLPCCEIVAERGVARVVFGWQDKDFGGDGTAYLIERGIEVCQIVGIPDEEFACLVSGAFVPSKKQAAMDAFLKRVNQEEGK